MFRLLTDYFSQAVRKVAQPSSYASTAGGPQQYFTNIERSPQNLSRWISIYEQGGLLSEAIDLYPLFMFSKGYTWEGDPKEIENCKTVLEGFDFENSLNMGVTGSLVCADEFQEIVPSRSGDIVGLMHRDPTTFGITFDEFGMVQGYTQTVKTLKVFSKTIPFGEPNILHIQLLPSLRGGYGQSLIKRCYDDIIRDAETAQSTTNGIKRHGTPKWWGRVGSPGEAVPESVINQITRKLEELNSKTDIATQYDVAIQALDTAGLPGIKDYTDISLIRLCGALGVPGELLGFRQGTTDNTAVSRIGAFLQKCQTLQTRLARAYNLQFFDQITGTPGAARIKFNSILPDQQAEKAAWIVNLMKATPVDPFSITPIEWIREQLNIPESVESARESGYFRGRVRSLGGQGSGNFGHSGRPGERGGSGGGGGIPQQAQNWGKVFKSASVEHYGTYNDDGELISSGVGDENSVKIDPITAKNAHVIHNHPQETETSFSPSDINAAIQYDMKSMSSVNTKGEILTLTRPEKGWPNHSREDIDSAHIQAMYENRGIREEIRDQLIRGKITKIEAASKYGNAVTKTMLKNLGLK